MMLGREGIRRKIELHVALFLVLLSPGYNPPRRRWCLYLSRGKPPSVCAYLSLPPSHSSIPAFRPPAPRSPPFHRTLNPPSGSSLSFPAPSNHPPRARARSHPSPLRSSSLASLYHRSPRHTLFSLSALSPPVRSHPPKTPLTPTLPILPTLLSTLYPYSTVSTPDNPPRRCLHPALRLNPTPTTR